MKREIYKNSYIAYSNNLNQCHKKGDKPNYIGFDGFISFCKKDKFHRKGKPSVIYPDGTLKYFEDDKFVKRFDP